MGFARLAAAALVVLVASACSLALESSPSQCETDGDCRARGGPFARAVCVTNRCVAPDNVACTTNKQCSDLLGEAAVCRARDKRCGRLLTPECPRVIGDATSEEAIILGTVFSTSGTNGPSGIARERSAELALNEIKSSVGGIRSSVDGVPRPLAIVQCNDELTLTGAQHLVDDVGVPAIIGAASSSRVIEIATNVTIPKGVLLITPAATSPAITSLPDGDLLWRTSPSDTLQAVAMVDQIPALEAKYRVDNAVPKATKLRAAFVYINEAYGLGLYEAVTRDAQLNGAPLSDPSNAGLSTGLSYPPNPPDLEAQITNILAQSPRPSLIVLIGSTEIVTKLIGPLESRWGTATPRPVYLAGDAVQKTELLDLVATDDSLRRRIRGSVPAPPSTSGAFRSFVFKYEGMFGAPAPTVFGMAGAYDATFLLAYAAAAAGSRALTGAELQKSFARLVKGAPIEVGGTNMNAGFQALASPGTFDFDGASGPLDFDLRTGEARSNIDVWCIGKGGNGRPTFVPTGRFFDAKTNAMTGTFALGTCQ